MTERLKQLLICFCFLNLANGFIAYDAHAQSKALSQQLEKISQIADKDRVLIELTMLVNTPGLTRADETQILIQRATTLLSLHRYSLGIEDALRAKNTAEQGDLPVLLSKANKMLGVLLYFQGELKPALKAYQASLAYFDNNLEHSVNNFAIERANLLNNIALVYTSLGQSNLALYNYQLAEPLYAEYGDEIDKVDIRYNIAVLHISLRRFDIAIDMLTAIIAKRQQLKDHEGVAKAKADLGIAYKHSGRFNLAKEHILSALHYFQQSNNKHEIASQLHNISELYNETFDVEQAIYYGKQALTISEGLGHKKAIAGSLQSLAKASFYSGELEQAQKYIERSIAIGEEIDYQLLVTENMAVSALIYAAKQQYITALSEQQMFEKGYLLASNNLLNDKLAEFESTQLNQKILDLEHRRELQSLQSAKIEQQRNLVILTLVLVLVVVFFIYRRYLEKRLTQELELRVKQRTSELEELSQELAQANQVKGQFLANMSHEIRTPLTAIVGHAEGLIHDEIDAKKMQQDIEIIHGNSLHLLELINDILDLSRIEANKFSLEIQPMDLKELIQDLSDTFTAQAQQKGLVFSIEHQLTLPFIISVDSLRLKQILLNLCANAIKFTEKGRVTLGIAYQKEQLTFTVTDTGIGLSKEHLAQVFEIFTQADNSISRRFGGSGLGLSLSNQLAKLMSGSIGIESKLGEGSSFCLTLPCQQYSHNALTPGADAIVTVPKEALFSGTVLLAEDHNDNRRLIARLLKSLGLDVLVAKNGREAVQQCLDAKPNLVLLDIQMPEMDGVEAFKKLRELGYNKPIYALTANAMSHEISQYLALGFTGHLKKPIERQSFIATLAKHFNDNSDNEYLVKEGESIDAKNAQLLRAEAELAQVDLSDLITEFKQNLAEDKRDLIDFNDKFDFTSLLRITHRLSGAAQMFGFKELNQVAQELEVILKKELNTDAPDQRLISELTHCLIDEISIVEQ